MILHLDGNSFFASVMQAAYPQYLGKPVVVGRERGIVTAASYEAKRLGITRGMHIRAVEDFYPSCIICEGDYTLFSQFSTRMFTILRSFTPEIEEYSIDEAFARVDEPLKGMKIQKKIKDTLGIPVSIGIGPTKCLAKQASEAKKPMGLTIITKNNLSSFLTSIPIADVWGIGRATTQALSKYGVHTAHDFVQLPRTLIMNKFNKPYRYIWNELQGVSCMPLDTTPKTTYQSIISSRTFSPTNESKFLWAQLRNHIEHAFMRARQYDYGVQEIIILLKTQEFEYYTKTITFPEPQTYPFSVLKTIRNAYNALYKKNVLYRTTGCTITKLKKTTQGQMKLFINENKKIAALYKVIENRSDVTFAQSLFSPHNKEKKFSLPTLEISV